MKTVIYLYRSSGPEAILSRLAMFLLLLASGVSSKSYGAVDAASPIKLSGFVIVTNKGISTVSKRTLGEPAAILGLSVAGQKLSFEPRFRWSLEDGRPWSFAFWWRYQLKKTDRFSLRTGVHSSISFKKTNIMRNGEETKSSEARRFLGGGIRGGYRLSDRFRADFRYLYRYGIESWVTKHTNHVAVGGTFSDIGVTERIRLAIQIQPSYLRRDDEERFHASANLTLSAIGSPISLGAHINQAINVDFSDEVLLWNVSVRYRFEL